MALLLPLVGLAAASLGGFSRTTYCAMLAVTKGLTPQLPSSARMGTKRPALYSTIRSVLESEILVGPQYRTMSPLVRSCT